MEYWEPYYSDAIQTNGWEQASRFRTLFYGAPKTGHPVPTYATGNVFSMGSRAIRVFVDGLIRGGIINR